MHSGANFYETTKSRNTCPLAHYFMRLTSHTVHQLTIKNSTERRPVEPTSKKVHFLAPLPVGLRQAKAPSQCFGRPDAFMLLNAGSRSDSGGLLGSDFRLTRGQRLAERIEIYRLRHRLPNVQVERPSELYHAVANFPI
jgi:hypothetical protein